MDGIVEGLLEDGLLGSFSLQDDVWLDRAFDIVLG